MMAIKTTLVMTLLIIAVIMDLRYFKVKNELCIIFGLAGIASNALSVDINRMHIYFLGTIIPFVVLFPLYVLNMLGAGDIKLFCALGAIIGISNIIVSIAYSFIFGLFIALSIMAARKNFLSRFKRVYEYFKSCLLTRCILPYEKANAESDGRLHFTIPIAIGTITACFLG